MYDSLTSCETAPAPSAPTLTRPGVEGPVVRQRPDLTQRQEQFAALAASVAGALYSTALRWSGNHAHAEDLVQETNLCAWRNFDRFTIGTCFKAWAFQILRFLFMNRRRSTASRHLTVDFQADESSLGNWMQQAKGVEPCSTDWESVFPDLVDDALKHALDNLPQTQRTLALCIPLGGLSYQECADELGIPLGTVMSRYARARARLQQELRRNAVRGMCCRNR